MKSLLSILAISFSALCFSQNPYSFSTYTETYSELVNPTPINVYDVDEDSWNDPDFTVPFGFNFEIGGGTYTDALQLGGGALINFPNLAAQQTQFFGLINDIADGNLIEGGAPSDISYSIEGDAGNRIAKVQYNNAAFAEEIEGFDGADPSADNRINFQIWFYETSNALELHFGSSTLPNPPAAFYGGQGPSIALAVGLNLAENTFDYAILLTGDPESPTPFDLVNIGAPTPPFTGMPQSGRVYRFDPSTTDIRGVVNDSFNLSPTLTTATLSISGDIAPNTTFKILDITGKTVLAGSIHNQQNIDVTSLSPGLYLFSINGLSKVIKFVKQ